jgi:hypothetical protein
MLNLANWKELLAKLLCQLVPIAFNFKGRKWVPCLCIAGKWVGKEIPFEPFIGNSLTQKFNHLMFLIGTANHAVPLMTMHRTEWRKERKKSKSHTQEQNKSRCKTEVFYGPFLPIWYCINLSFWYLDAVCSVAMGVLFVWIPCGIPYVKTTRWHT